MAGSMHVVTTPPMESLFSLLRRNVLDRRRWTTRDELRFAIIVWIERTYQRRRRRALVGLRLIEYETLTTVRERAHNSQS